MKTFMQNKPFYILLYDSDCPLCSTYTRWFVQAGLLNADGRLAYHLMHFAHTPIDAIKARNRIALYQPHIQQVYYGIDALDKIISAKFPFVHTCLSFKPLYAFMNALYDLISYNRKIIVPVSCTLTQGCSPDRSWFWRLAFVLFSGIAFASAFSGFAHAAGIRETVLNAPGILLCFFILQLLVQGLIGRFTKFFNAYAYIGHNAFVYFSGTLLLGLSQHFLKWLSFLQMDTSMPALFIYVGVSIFMFFAHIRRMMISVTCRWLSFTWMIAYIVMTIVAATER